MVSGFYHLFYKRSLGFDGLFLFIIPITLIIYTSLPSILAAFIAITGVYVIFGRKQKHRYSDTSIGYIGFALALYATAHMLVIWASGGYAAELCLPYPAWFALVVPLSVGLALVRDPLRMLVLGSRITILMVVAYAAFFLISQQPGRLALGTNPLIAAYAILLFSCVARFPAYEGEPLYLGKAFFYITILAFAATGSRIALVFYVLASIADISLYCIKALKQRSFNLSVMVISSIALIFAAAILSQFGARLRLETFSDFFANGFTTDKSLLLRLDLWRVGVDLFASNPLFGVGRCVLPDLVPSAMEALQGRPYQFKHLHNVFIDELAAHGLIGLILVISFHALILKRLITWLDAPGQRMATLMLFGAIFIYGLTGTHISDDRMTVVTVLVFGVLLSAAKRKSLKAHYAHSNER